MKIGLIGLGKIGLNLALNMNAHNHEVVSYKISDKACEIAVNSGINCHRNLGSFIEALPFNF